MTSKTKPIIILIILLIGLCNPIVRLNAQLTQKELYYKSIFYKIVKDTLWLNQRLWEYYSKYEEGKNPIYNIQNDKEAKDFDFVVVPIYEVTPKGTDYDYSKEIIDMIDLDTTAFWAYVKYQNKIVGNIYVKYGKNYVRYGKNYVLSENDCWFGFLNLYDNYKLHKIAKKIMKLKADSLFTIRYLDGLWFRKGNEIKVYSKQVYDNKIYSEIKYIKKTSSIEAIKGYANGKVGGLLP